MPASAACLDSPSAIPAAPSAGSTRRGLCRIIVIDDDRRLASTTAQWLCSQGWHATAAGSADEALQAIGRGPLDACLLDGGLPAGGSLRVAAVLRSTWPEAALLVACPTASPAAPAELLAVADASLTMPCRDDDLLASLAAAANAARTRAAAPGVAILGKDPAIRAVLDLANRVAATPATVLITGESGTGKSLLARQIHAASRRSGRFVEVACGSLAESLLESELFGHVAGAFTGAVAAHDGMFLRADRGTIFLDEIATASPALQVKLLRVLQDFEFEPLGGGDTRRVDARVILATNEHLDQLVADGRFRADLYWRINVVALEMPPLRSRRDDILLLAHYFLARASRMVPRTVEGFAPAAEELLLQHAWPGNVRELQHAVERAVLLGRGPLIEPADLPASLRSPPSAVAASLKQALADPERQLILEALERHGWRRDAAAKALGINRTSLYKKARRLGMDLTALPAG
jgi:DNA-binding NtrC family response regulator